MNRYSYFYTTHSSPPLTSPDPPVYPSPEQSYMYIEYICYSQLLSACTCIQSCISIHVYTLFIAHKEGGMIYELSHMPATAPCTCIYTRIHAWPTESYVVKLVHIYLSWFPLSSDTHGLHLCFRWNVLPQGSAPSHRGFVHSSVQYPMAPTMYTL